MKTQPRFSLWLFIAFLLCTGQGYAQLTGWSYRMPVAVSDSSGVALTNYQVRLDINTAALVTAGHMEATGADIRFGDSCSSSIYPHYVESGINTANTIIWVTVPSVPANGTATIYMYYGNPSATGTGSFSAVFPAAFISSGSVTLTGIQNYDWFQLNATDTVFTTAGAPLTINARNIILDGTIYGTGRGYQAPAVNTAGTGPGGGGTSANAGSGGGSYGGVGGMGGLDAGDTPGNGGPASGTASGLDIDMGSSGGSGTTVGGSGGGAVHLNADYISVSATGRIHMNGGAAVSTASTSRGGGGGAGGGILLTAGHVILGGVFSANGSDGAAGTSTANDSGGGGGGGRVKVFYSGTTSGTVTMTAAFGVGGPFGTQAPGQPGTVGSTSNVFGGGYDVPPVVLGGESPLFTPVLTLSATSICSNDSINATATAGFSSYVFMVNGNPVSTGTANSYTFNGLSNGDILSVAGITSPCFAAPSEPDTISVTPASVAGTVASTANTCQGGDDTLSTSGSSGVITWYEFDGTNYNFVGTGNPLILGPMNTVGTFSFVAVADNAGCSLDTSGMTTTTVSAGPLAGTISTTLADTNLCAFDSIVFTANGSNGTITWYVQFMQTGPYQFFGTGNSFNPGPPSNSDIGAYNFIAVASALGCPDDTSASIPVFVRETPVVALGNDTIICGSSLLLDAGNPGYSYLWNTNDTTQTLLATTSMAYDVAITTPFGCVGRDTINLTINQPPVVDLGPDTTACGSITLDAGNAGASYLWSNGPATQTNLITASGLYYVDVTSGPGCTDADTINVVVNTPPSVTLSVSTSTVCIDDANVVLTGGSPAGGTYAGPGVSGNQFDPTVAGNGTHTITYTYTDTNGCSAQATAQITVNACVGIADNALLESVVVYPNPNNGSFNLAVTGGEPGDMIIEVTDITGRVVYSQQENNVGTGFVTTVDLGDVAEGSYFLRITSGNETRTEKLVIE